MAQQLPKRLINVTEFEGMFRNGIFKDNERLELLEGGIYEMSPVGAIHMACVKFLSRFFHQNFVIEPRHSLLLSLSDEVHCCSPAQHSAFASAPCRASRPRHAHHHEFANGSISSPGSRAGPLL